MKIFLISLVALFTLTGYTGCEGEKSASPVADDGAWCKTKYADEAACNADERCAWKVGKAKCDAK